MVSTVLNHQSIENNNGALDSLMQVSYLAGKSLDLDQALPETLAGIAALLPVDLLTILQVQDNRVSVRAGWASERARLALQRDCWFHKDAFPMLQPDDGDEDEQAQLVPFQLRKELPYLIAREPITLLRIPLMVDHTVIGRFDLVREGGAGFSATERRFARACAKVLGLAMRNGMEYARVAWLAEHDPLTGLGNRRQFDWALARELARAERYGRVLSLLLIDVDDFKAVNTKLGLSGGDEVLRRTAQVLASGARQGVDISCRIGGDEFALVLPEVNEHAAADLAQRLLNEVERATAPLSPLRFSYSTASYPASSADELRRIADVRLLDAKLRKDRRMAFFNDQSSTIRR